MSDSANDEHVVEVHEPGREPRRFTIEGDVAVGRECDGIVVDDATVSRRHLQFELRRDTLTVVDLESRNGTRVNGERITEPVALAVGDTVALGAVAITVVGGPPPPSQVHPALHELEARAVEGAVVRFRPGTPGERAAAGIATAVRRAAQHLAGLGPKLEALAPQICLVDPFADPSAPGQLVTSGSVVDAARREIWMVVTAESPPEPLERPLALLLGATLPAGADPTSRTLLEGYGLFVAGTLSPDGALRDADLPPLEDADGELRTAMAQSFVAFLIRRAGRDEFVRMLTDADAGGLDSAARDVYGQTLAALEETWTSSLGAPGPNVKAGRFLRLTVRYLRPYARREGEIFIYMLFALVFTTVFPFAMRRLLDTAIPNHNLGQALSIVGVLGGAFLISLLAGLRRAYLSAYVSSAVTRDLRVQMFTRLQRLSPGWFDRQQEGDILSRLFSDVAQLEASLSTTIREGIFQVLTLVVAAAVLLTLDVFLGLVVLIGAPLVGIVYRAMASGAQRRSLAVQEELGTTYTVASENYGAQAVVKAFSLEDHEGSRFARASERLFGREVKLQLFGGLFGLSVNVIVTVLQLTVLALGSWLIVRGNLTVGGLVAFSTTMGQVLSPVTALTGLGQQIQAATGSLLRINEVVETVPDIDDTPDAVELPRVSSEIRFRRVGFSYSSDRTTLDDLDCVIPARSRVAFVGPTGAGKSSALALIMRFYDVDDGAIMIDGHDLRAVTVSSLRQQIGVVFQETFLFDTTIRENIAIGKPGASDAEVEAAARAAELHEFIDGLPRKYNTLVGERGGRLSGGQRQRLALARALLRDPSVLLLDEATSALDARTERLINQTLERVGEARTTVAVTHRLTSITQYDHIFVLSSGRIAEHGTHAELLALGGLYAALWSEQTGAVEGAEAPFDAAAALGAVHFFAGLSRQELASIAAQLRPFDLPTGASLREDTGALTIVKRGRPRIVAANLTSGTGATAILEPGDAFGISALLGVTTAAMLVADEPVTLLVLDDEDLADAAATHPSVAAALAGAAASSAGPAGGERLTRSSVVFRPSRAVAPIVPSDAPGSEAIRRMSGVFPVVQP